MIVVILAGGKGTRLWPLSNNDLPKQFLRIKDHRSLLQKTYLRFVSAAVVKKIIIITNEKYKNLVQQHLKEINEGCVVISEPCSRNTAPAISLVLKYLTEKGCDVNTKILISPSDHFISPDKKFREYLTVLEKASFENSIVTFGIRPTKPDTGYGYIKIKSNKIKEFYLAEEFIEKPPIEKAQDFFLKDEYFWNAGFFVFTIKKFWENLKKYCPEVNNRCLCFYKQVYENFHQMPNISFDYAVMEKTKNIKVFPLELSWSDVGSWDNLYDVLEKDEDQNVKHGDVLTVDTKNSLIIAEKRLISTIGLENIIIVETEEGIFIGKKGQSQKIKTIIEKLKNKPLKNKV